MKMRNQIAVIVFGSAALFSSDPSHAQFVQQGPKLVGTGAVGTAGQGLSVSLSADGNTAIVVGHLDDNGKGAAWVWTRSAGVWSQQTKLVGASGCVSASLSADGNTAIVAGAGVWTRSGGVWTQQGKLVQGSSVSLSADGDTALVGEYNDNNGVGAAWVWTRTSGVWTQQGGKLVGSSAVGANQGSSVSLSADGNTAIVGGYNDNNGIGAAWVWTRTSGVWTQQGGKLVGTGAVGSAQQGISVSLSTDGNTAIVGGPFDNPAGAAWVWTRRESVWAQQGEKLVESGAVGWAQQGSSVSLSADGNTAIIGGQSDNHFAGAAWVWARSGGVWTHQGTKLVGLVAVGNARQGTSVALSGDGSTALLGGPGDNNSAGAAWVFVVSSLVVSTPTVSPTRSSTGENAHFIVSGTFTDTSNAASAPFTAVVNWGDATSDTATVTGSASPFSYSFSGTHAYAEGGAYNVTVSVTNGSQHTTVTSSPSVVSVGQQFAQQGPKLVASDAIAGSSQGVSVSLSADGSTALVGGQIESWVWTKDAGDWTRSTKIPESGHSVSLSADGATALLSTSAGAVPWSLKEGVWVRGASLEAPEAYQMTVQAYSVALSADGQTAIVGGFANEGAWVWSKSGGVWAQQGPMLVAGDAVGPAWQGRSVSLSADGNTAIIGGLADNGSTGAAWIWTRAGSVWSQQGPKLVGSGAVGNGQQGSSVALSADGNTAIVGGVTDNDVVGAAWVWTRTAGVWTQQGAKLVGSASIGDSQQGVTVAISADGDTAIVGGNYDDHIGAAWVWTRSAGLWTQQGAKLVGSQSTYRAFQANSVSLAADGNVAIIGGPDDHYLGAAWLWTRSAGVWTEQIKLVDLGASGIAYQGYSVALSADGNTAIVGGFGDNRYVGAAWIWTRSGSVWTQGPKLIGSDVVDIANQGWSVSISADGNTAIIGGPRDNSFAGAAWVWIRNGGGWTQQGPKLVGSGAVGAASQGNSVSLSADGNTAVVGGGNDDSQIGAAWVWTRTGGFWTQQGPKLVGSGAVFGKYGSWQGNSVSISADGNTALVAGENDNDATGAVWVWTRSGSIWAQQGPKLVGLDSVGSAPYQGCSVSLSSDGNTAIVGGWQDHGDALGVRGAAWIWARSGSVWTQEGSKLVGSGAAGDGMGSAVSLSASGDLAVVAGGDGNAHAGALWFWTRNGSVWTQQGPKLPVQGAVASSGLDSVSLSADGRTVIAGTYWDNNFAGAAWVFAWHTPRRRPVRR